MFAISQLTHVVLDHPTVAGVAQAAFLLLVVWWAWIYTMWMANWFDPASPVIHVVLTGGMLASLVMAVAIPQALGEHGLLFAAAYVALQVGRNAAAGDIEGGHFAERCQLFIIIALGESIVVTGATASAAGLTPVVLLCLVVAFAETAALWWIHFGGTAEDARAVMTSSEDPGRLGRDAYTYGHLPLVAGIIATAVGQDLLIAHPGDVLHGIGPAVVIGGPALFLLGVGLFRRRIAAASRPRLARHVVRQ